MAIEQPLSDERLAGTASPWWLHREYSTIYVEAKCRDSGLTQEVAAIGPKEGGREQQEADARLIVAARDLLAALQRIVSEGDFTAPEGMKRIAIEAIAKVLP